MKRSLAMTMILLCAVFNLEAGVRPKQGGGTVKPQQGQPKPTLKPKLQCIGVSNDVAFYLKVTNDGPGEVPKGTPIAYSYTTSKGKHAYGESALQSALAVNQTESILINGAWQTVVVSCKCYIK